jgi:hypothetical protein
LPSEAVEAGEDEISVAKTRSPRKKLDPPDAHPDAIEDARLVLIAGRNAYLGL